MLRSAVASAGGQAGREHEGAQEPAGEGPREGAGAAGSAQDGRPQPAHALPCQGLHAVIPPVLPSSQAALEAR